MFGQKIIFQSTSLCTKEFVQNKYSIFWLHLSSISCWLHAIANWTYSVNAIRRLCTYFAQLQDCTLTVCHTISRQQCNLEKTAQSRDWHMISQFWECTTESWIRRLHGTYTHTLVPLHSPGLELLGTEGMCDVLNGVTEAVGVVVGGIDAPLVPRVGVGRVLDSIGHRVLFAVLHNQLHTKGGLRWEGNASFNFLFFLGGIQHKIFRWLWNCEISVIY